MRLTSHPRQSMAITALVCVISVATVLVSISRPEWANAYTPATLIGFALCIFFALLVGWLRAGTWPAAFTGALLLAATYLPTVTQPSGSCWRSALTPLIVLLVLTLLATRFRRAVKEKSGLAESRQGRSSAQVCANLGVAALSSAFLLTPSLHTIALLALSAAFVEATADTLSSEIGQAISNSSLSFLHSTILLTTGKPVPAGTDGGVSILGTLAGIAGGALVAASCTWTLQLTYRETLLVWTAGIAGIFFDSLLGATLERRGWLGNDAVNFSSTLFSALLAAALAFAWLA